ncbi:inositol 1,3,4-trisphosphate 5/6-kinase 4-like isoform X2 [Coffea arabica]|uniref:Inositol 1,3,4-trisphosphate 5/6-kinase 4-like isoform X2 n=1 Tax=Coffea arabica TaxID=13443 RepID=A0ABM4X4K3_COFAR
MEAESKENILVVGYIMKPSRKEDFAKRGAFPSHPTQNGLIFLPLNFELPISSQLQQVDVLLHKATDEIVDVKMSSSSEFVDKIEYTKGMQDLQRYTESHPECCVIDPFPNIYPVLDRLRIQQILFGLENLCIKSCYRIRGPRFLKVNSFEEPNLEHRLFEAKLSFPNIVKPQVACGVAVAHSMAIVFNIEQYKGLNVPLPAVVQVSQELWGLLIKIATLMGLPEACDLKPILFDSLKSLPIDKKNQQVEDGVSSAGIQQLDLELVTDAANWLRSVLNLTIFGFDVVIQEATGDHVIVDLNYLPSFKEVPDDVAIPAFWEAIKWRFKSEREVEFATDSNFTANYSHRLFIVYLNLGRFLNSKTVIPSLFGCGCERFL